MLAGSIALGILAVALAWPVPILLSRASWPAQAPATALVLWQAIALSGGLSMIGALLTFGLIPFGDDLISSGLEFARTLSGGALAPAVPVAYLLSISAAMLLALHLVLNLAFTTLRIGRQRRRHRELVDLLTSPDPDRPHTRLIDVAMPVAYCLPGTDNSVTVFSAGLVKLLDADELEAVVEHERAHLLQRHYLVLLAFDAWRTSLPWFPVATVAEREVGMLVEMLADDRARRSVDDRTLASAIALVAGGDGEPGSLSGSRLAADTDPLGRRPDDVRARVVRLVSQGAPLTESARAAVWAIAIGLVAVPTVLLFTPALAG